MTSWLGIQTAKAKDVQDVSGQMYIDLAKDLQARNQVKNPIRALTPEEIGENLAFHGQKVIAPVEHPRRETEFNNIRHWMSKIIPDYQRIKEDPVALRKAISQLPEKVSDIKGLEPWEMLSLSKNPSWNFKDEFESNVPYVVNYSKHLKDKEHVNRYPLPSADKLKEVGRELENNSFKGAAPEYFKQRYGDVFAGKKNNRLLRHLSHSEEIAFPTKYEELKEFLGYKPNEKITARELDRLQNFDMNAALARYESARSPEDKQKYLHEYNHARSAQALAFMEPRERAISAKSNYEKALKEAGTDEAKIKSAKTSYENEPRLQVHYPLEEEVTLNPHDYPGEWYADQPSEITEGNEALKKSAEELTADSKLMRDERKALYDTLNGRTSIGDMTDADLRRLRLNASEKADAIDDSDYIDSRTYKRFQDEAKQEYGFVEKKINQRLQDDIRAVRSQYSARGQHGPALLKQENDMRSRAAEQLQRTYHDLINSFQKQGISATQAERADKANKVNLYRGATGQENQALLNSAQMKAQNEMSHQQLAHQNLLQKHQAMLLPNVATNDQANALINIGTRQQTNAQNKNNTLRYQHLANHQNWFNERMGLINAAQGIPTPPTFQANAMTPAMPVANSPASHTANIAGTIAQQAGNIVQGQQNQGRPQNIYIGNHPYAHGGHVSSNDLMKAYHSQLDAYEKAARGYAAQHEDYLPTGLQAAGDAFLGIARQGRGGDPLKGFAEGMDKGQERHNQYMKRGREREGLGLQLEQDMAKGRGQAWKDLASHENEVSKIDEQRRYHDAYLGLEREKMGASKKKSQEAAMMRQKGMIPVFDDEGNVVEMKAAPRVLTGAQTKRQEEALANLSNAFGAAATLSVSGAAASHLPKYGPAGVLPNNLTGTFWGGKGGISKLNQFDTMSTNVANYLKSTQGIHNIPEFNSLKEGKLNSGKDPVTNKSTAHAGAIGLSTVANKSVETLLELGWTPEEVEEQLNRDIEVGSRIKKSDADAFASVSKFKEKTAKDFYQDSDHTWNEMLKGIRRVGKNKEDRDLSNFNHEEPVEEQVQDDSPMPVAEAESNATNVAPESSLLDDVIRGGKNTYDFANSALANAAIGLGKGATSLVDMATYPIRKPLSMAIGEPVRGLTEKFIEPVEKAYEEWEEPKDRSTLAKSTLQGGKYLGEALGGAGIGGGLIGGALKYGPEAAKGFKAFVSALKKGDLQAIPQYIGRALGGGSFLKATAGNTSEIKELAKLAGATGAVSKGIQEETELPQWGSDLLALPAVIAGHQGSKGFTKLFDKSKLPKDRVVTEELLGEYLFPTEESLKRHESHFENYKEPYKGHTSTVAEAAEGLNSNIGSVSKKVGLHSDTAKNRQAESINKAQEVVGNINPSKSFMKENKFKDGDLLEQAHQKKKPNYYTPTEDTADSIRKDFADTLTKDMSARSAASKPFYDQIEKYEGKIPLEESSKVIKSLAKQGKDNDISHHVKWFNNLTEDKDLNKINPFLRATILESHGGPSVTGVRANEISKELGEKIQFARETNNWDELRVLKLLKTSIDNDLVNAVPAAKTARETYRNFSDRINNILDNPSLKKVLDKKDRFHTQDEVSLINQFLHGQKSPQRARDLVKYLGYDSKAVKSLRDYTRNDLFESVVRDGRIDQSALKKWTEKNAGAFKLDKNLKKDVVHLNSIKSYQELMESKEKLTPHKFFGFMEENGSNLKNILSQESMKELDEIGGLMKKLQHAQAKVAPGESATSVFEDISKKIFHKKENHYLRASTQLASKIPYVGKGVDFIKGIMKLANPGDSSLNNQRVEWAAEILNDPKAFKEFMSRHRGRQIFDATKDKGAYGKVALNRLINDTSGR